MGKYYIILKKSVIYYGQSTSAVLCRILVKTFWTPTMCVDVKQMSIDIDKYG